MGRRRAVRLECIDDIVEDHVGLQSHLVTDTADGVATLELLPYAHLCMIE